jgi:hypothetical protein
MATPFFIFAPLKNKGVQASPSPEWIQPASTTPAKLAKTSARVLKPKRSIGVELVLFTLIWFFLICQAGTMQKKADRP